MESTIKFESNNLKKRLKSMLKVDFRRMFTMPLFYIITGICLVMPILILVMTTMMDGTTTIDPTTGVETTIEGFDNVWQSIGSISGEGSAISMDLTSMVNINILYFIIAILVCLFVSADFRSGYAKNIFTVRAKKEDYIISKTLVGIVSGICMLIAYFIGAMIGGAISSLPFDLGSVGINGVLMCMISKMLLVAVFVPIYLLMSVVGKQRTWLSIVGSLAIGMLFFTMIPMLTPLNSTFMNIILCLSGGILFSIGLGAVSNLILRKTSLV